MKKATKYFSNVAIQSIEDAIAQAEQNTSGEIVPVVATASGRYDRAEDIVGLLFAMILLSIAWLSTQESIAINGQWEGIKTATLSLPLALIVIFTGFVTGTMLAGYFPVLRLPFISKKEMQEEVQIKAAQTFQLLRLRNTQAATGVLIYVSLYERMVSIIGDDAISEKLSQDDWDQVCAIVVNGMKSGKPHTALEEAVAQCGKLLSQHFPRQDNDENELPNKLHLVH